MIVEFLAIIAGILSGTLTGLIPGIHTNLIAAILITMTIPIKNNILLIYIISLAITHTFTDFIPSIYFSAPSPDTGLSIMPGHKMLLAGKGHLAIKYTLTGSLIAILVFIVTIPVHFLFLEKLYPYIEIMIPWTLTLITIFLISKSKRKKESIIIIILASFLGIFTLNSNINQPLLPLLTGLFGTSSLIISIQNNVTPPKQKITSNKNNKKDILIIFLKTLLISPICSLMPGLGSSQAATISQTKKQDNKHILTLLGSINTLVLSTSFITLYLINKKRSGAAEAISQIITINSSHLQIIILTILITAIIATITTTIISKLIAKNIHKINYILISKIILLTTTIIIFIISKFYGLLILATATLIGILAIKLKVQKTHLMTSIIVPTIFYYLP